MIGRVNYEMGEGLCSLFSFIFLEKIIFRLNFVKMFIGGRALQNSAEWLTLLSNLQENPGLSHNAFCVRSIRSSGINILDNSFTNKKLPIKFRNKFYPDFESLQKKFIPNSPTVNENLEHVLAEIHRLFEARVVSEVDEATALESNSCLNPILWHSKTRQDGTVKNRLVMQGKINSYYSKPKMNLPEVMEELENFAKLDLMIKHDLR